MTLEQLVIASIISVGSFFAGWFINSQIGKNKVSFAEDQAKKILSDAERDGAAIHKEKMLEVKDEWYKKNMNLKMKQIKKRINSNHMRNN